MSDIIKPDEQKSELLQSLADESLLPALEESQIGITNYTKVPMTRLASLGTAFQPLATAVQTAVNGAGGSGLYYVDTAGKTMFQMKGSTEFIGSLKTADGLVGGGQAKMTALACDPTMLFMAAALANVDKKLDAISEMQQEMMDYLVRKDKAELKGNLNFLYEVFEKYKSIWNNDAQRVANLGEVMTVKRESEAKIVNYRESIISKVNKKSFIHSDKSVEKQLQEIQDYFKDYQLALYILSFSSFLEVMLSANYDSVLLTSITDKLESYSIEYRELYTRCYEEIEEYSSSSVQSHLLKGASKLSSFVGKTVEKIPVVSDGQVDETLVAFGDKLQDLGDERLKKQMTSLIERQSNFVKPFVDNINMVNELYNKPVKVLLDEGNLYIGVEE